MNTPAANRVVVYLQNQSNLTPFPDCFPYLTAINLSSFHFGFNTDNTPYIHLNDHDPDYPPFVQNIWPLMKNAQQAGVKAIAMLGGAGGAYTQLFQNYSTFYPLWRDMLQQYHLDGVDLDVEEQVSQSDIEKLINDLRKDFPSDFAITSAPVASALSGGIDPLSGIRWLPLANLLDWFNVQFYSGFGSLSNTGDYDNIIKAGFQPAQILGGALTNNHDGHGYIPINTLTTTLTSLNQKYNGQLGGTMGWEFYNANGPDEQVDPVAWCKAMHGAVS